MRELQESLERRLKSRRNGEPSSIAEFDVVNDRMLAVRDDLTQFVDNTGKRIVTHAVQQHRATQDEVRKLRELVNVQGRSIDSLIAEISGLRDSLQHRWHRTAWGWVRKCMDQARALRAVRNLIAWFCDKMGWDLWAERWRR